MEPIYSEFETIHNDYLASFKKYRSLIGNENQPLKELLENIRNDNLLSSEQREKIKALIRLSDDPVVGSFIEQIHEYLTNPYDYIPMHGGLKYRNKRRWRTNLLHQLELIDKIEKNKSKRAHEALDIISEQMQELYGLVTKEYVELKKVLFG